jgi:hypothetical protein
MSIQFDCVACGKRIEIDDAWGGRLVECPYCRDTITAPAYSTGNAPEEHPSTGHPSTGHPNTERPGFAPTSESPAEPAASPTGTHDATNSTFSPHGVPHFEPSHSTPWPQAQMAPPVRESNKLAIVALVLACVSILLGIAAMIPIVGAISNNLGVDAKPEEVNAFFEKAAADGAPWMIKVSLYMLAGFGMWVAGLVCACVAVRRKTLRGVAIAALVVIGFPVGLFLMALACTP